MVSHYFPSTISVLISYMHAFHHILIYSGQYNDAITFYASSGCYNHSIRLARAYNLDTELMRYVLLHVFIVFVVTKFGSYKLERQYFILRTSHLLSLYIFPCLSNRYALKSTPALMIECAVHFEQRREFDKAVQLYHKGKQVLLNGFIYLVFCVS